MKKVVMKIYKSMQKRVLATKVIKNIYWVNIFPRVQYITGQHHLNPASANQQIPFIICHVQKVLVYQYNTNCVKIVKTYFLVNHSKIIKLNLKI